MDLREIVAAVAKDGPVRPSGGQYLVCCPAHGDQTPSLSIAAGTTQPAIFHCFAGCETEAILEAAGLTWEQISAPREDDQREVARDQRRAQGNQTYDYRDASGGVVYQVVRQVDREGNKKFLQRHQDETGAWVWNMRGVSRVIYRLPEVLAAIAAGEPVWIVEGEKDADALVIAGVCATCNSGGAGKWQPEYAQWFADADVTIVADRDEPGRAHASHVRDSLVGIAASVRKVESAHGKDAYDHLFAGGTIDSFEETEPAQIKAKPTIGLDIDDYLAQILPDQRFVFPNVLAESEVWMVTGYEGHGKSLLLKQLAVQAAVGVHPWTLEKMTPQTVLVVDTENATRDSIPDLAKLRFIAAAHTNWADRARLVIEEPGPIDVLRPEWREWLIERVRTVQPALIVAGPIYRMVGRELRDEDTARVLMETITAVQQVNNAAVILEHHVAKASNGERPLDPLGSGLMMRWANFITGLRPMEVDGKDTGFYSLDHQRKGRRRNRAWPTHLRWGNGGVEWPWEPSTEAEASMAVARATE